MNKRLEGIIQIALAVGIILLVFYFSDMFAQLKEYGYLGVFIISALSSATLIFPAPGWAIVIAMSKTLDPFILGVVAGLGSAIGEMTGYLAGDGVRDILNNRIKETKYIEGTVKKYGIGAIFVFAFIPNPLFDVAGLISGALKIKWWQFLIACAMGRILRYVLLAWLGFEFLSN